MLQLSGLEKVGRRNEAAGRKYFDTLHCQEVILVGILGDEAGYEVCLGF